MITSARRRASASYASRASRSRSIATPSSEASAGTRRRRVLTSEELPPSSVIVPTRRPPAVSANPSRASSPSVISARVACNARAASAEICSRSASTVPCSSSAVATSASSEASRARRRDLAASSETTIEVTTKTTSANQLRESASVSVCTGSRKKKLNASMLATDTTTAYASPQTAATGRTAKM